MWFQPGLSYRLVLVLILPAAYCQITPISFAAPNSQSVLTKGNPFDVTWLMASNKAGTVRLELALFHMVDSSATQVSTLKDLSWSTDGYYSSLLWYTWTPSLSLSSGDDYVLTVTDVDSLVTIVSNSFTLRDPSPSSVETTTVTTSPPTTSVALSTFPTSSPTKTASTSPESSSTPSSPDSSPAAAIGGSVGGVFAAIVIAFILVSWRKGWFIGKTQDPELGEMDGGEVSRANHLSELEENPGRYLTELPGSVPVFELPEGGHGERAELPGSVPSSELPEGGHDEGAEGVGTL